MRTPAVGAGHVLMAGLTFFLLPAVSDPLTPSLLPTVALPGQCGFRFPTQIYFSAADSTSLCAVGVGVGPSLLPSW